MIYQYFSCKALNMFKDFCSSVSFYLYCHDSFVCNAFQCILCKSEDIRLVLQICNDLARLPYVPSFAPHLLVLPRSYFPHPV